MRAETPFDTATVLQFGRFQFHPYSRQLLQGERPVQVGSRALDILRVLIARPGEIIPKESIIAQVWGGTVVEEINLRVHIAALRRALGEGRTGERYIANVPLRGYGFVGVVETLGEAPPAAASSVAGNLPVLLVGLVGREQWLRQLVERVPRTRILTLVGPGGMGKTSLAIQVAEHLREDFPRVCFADLSSYPDGVALSHGLARLLGEPAGGPLLLLLDNCEHLARDCAEQVEHLLRLHPALHILATSREPLRAAGEHVLRLSPLEVPEPGVSDPQRILGCSAIELFLARAREASEHFALRPAQLPMLANICRSLDGIPLAIEMAARQVDVVGLEALEQLLGSRMHLLMPGRRTAPARQQSLQATYDWSFCLLDACQQSCLRQLAEFAGAFSLSAAAEALDGALQCRDCIFGVVGQLVEKSLLLAEHGERGVLYRMPNTVRAYVRRDAEAGWPQLALPVA